VLHATGILEEARVVGLLVHGTSREESGKLGSADPTQERICT